MAIKGVLFDFDGTLTQPGALDFARIRKEIHCPEGSAILEYINACEPGLRDELTGVLTGHEHRAALQSVPNKGAEACIRMLRSMRIQIGILSRNSRASIITAFKNFSCTRMEDFGLILSREDAVPKPDPDGVHKTISHMKISPGSLLVCGDYRYDILAGKAAGAVTLLLTNADNRGTGAYEMPPGDPIPDFTAGDLMQVIEIVKGFRG